MSLTQVNSAGIADGAIVNADVNNSAAVALSKLSTSGTASSSTFLRGDGAWTAIDLANLSASNLTSGTVPDARFPATLPALSGTALTNLNASNISSGTLAAARLPASYAVLSGSTDNQIATVTGANALQGEANLTFNGSGDLTVKGNDGISANLYLIADRGDDNGDGWRVGSNQDDNDLTFANNTSGSYVDKITLLKTGEAKFHGNIFTNVLRRDVQNSSVILSGGNATNDGANIALYGSTHSSQAGNFEFRSGSSYVLKIKSDGKIGIGTSSPAQLLHVWPDAANTTSAYVRVTAGDRNSNTGVQLGHNSSGNGELNVVSNGHLTLFTNNSERITITNTGNIGIGDTSPDCRLHVNAGAADDVLKLESTDNAVNLILTDAAGSSLIQQNNDMLNINCDPASAVSGSTIRFNIDGANVGTFLNNQFRLGSNSAGIQFNGNTAAANSLDGYEEGSWTPILNKSGATGAVDSYTNQVGKYVRVGKLLWISFYVYKASGSFGTGTGSWYISGLPWALTHGAGGAYQFLSDGYWTINGSGRSYAYGGQRWQSNNQNGSATLTLYADEQSTNWSSGAIEASGTGVVEIS